MSATGKRTLYPKALLFFLLCYLIPELSPAQPRIGLQLYTFRNQLPNDVPRMLEKISQMGIRYLEGGGTYNLPKETFKELLRKNNLQMVSVGASFEELEKDPQAVAEKATFFGAAYVMCSWVPHKGEVFTIDDARRAVAVFNKAGKILKTAGLQFKYHAHGYEFQRYNGGTLFDYMVKEMNPAYANFQMDVFWFKHSGQNPAAYLAKYPKRFLSLHLKDRRKGTTGNVTGRADVETNVVLGTGDVNIAAVMKAAKKAGIKYAFIEDESSLSLEQVPKSITYLKTLK